MIRSCAAGDSSLTGTPGIQRYGLARGWYQNKAAVTAAVKTVLRQRAQAGITPAQRPVMQAVRVPAELANIATLARTAHEQGAPIVTTAAILAELDDEDMSTRRLSDLLLGWTGHRFDRQNHNGDQLRGPRVEHILTALDRINTDGPITLDTPTAQ